jgi:hypothetical protein
MCVVFVTSVKYMLNTNMKKASVPLSSGPMLQVGVKTEQIFFNRIRDRIRLEEFRYVRIRVKALV